MYSDSRRTSKMELIAKIVNGLKPLTTFAISSILDVRLGPEYILVWLCTLVSCISSYIAGWVHLKCNSVNYFLQDITLFYGGSFFSRKHFFINLLERDLWDLSIHLADHLMNWEQRSTGVYYKDVWNINDFECYKWLWKCHGAVVRSFERPCQLFSSISII